MPSLNAEKGWDTYNAKRGVSAPSIKRRPAPPRTSGPATPVRLLHGFHTVAAVSGGIDPDVAFLAAQATQDTVPDVPDPAPFEYESRLIPVQPLISQQDQPSFQQWCNPKTPQLGYWSLYRSKTSKDSQDIKKAIATWEQEHPDVRGPSDLVASDKLAGDLFA